MRISVGIKSLAEAEYFLNEGADEVYFSLATARGHRGVAFTSEKEMIAAVRVARRLRKKSMLALNAVYRPESYASILEQARSMKKEGLYGITVRDPALLEYFRGEGFRPYFGASVLSACFNSGSFAFFSELGVRRFTLNTQVLPADAAKIRRRCPAAEMMIFVPCLCMEPNIEPYCFFPYPGGPSGMCYHACTLKYRCGVHDFHMVDTDLYFQAGQLYDYHRLGAEWLKVSRQPNTPKLMAEFKITKYLNGLLEKGLDRKAFGSAVSELIQRAEIGRYGPSFEYRPFPGRK